MAAERKPAPEDIEEQEILETFQQLRKQDPDGATREMLRDIADGMPELPSRFHRTKGH